MTTVKKISEQAQRIYARGLHSDDVSPTIDLREIYLLVEQAVNQVLKIQSYEPAGIKGLNIPKCSIATYENIAVTDTASYSYAAIPVVPIHLPMDMGVWEVCPQDDILNPFIPLVGAEAAVMYGTNASYLEQQDGYRVEGMKVIFKSVIADSEVIMKLLVNDVATLGTAAVLPLTADQELTVLQMVLEMLGMGSISQYEMNKSEEQEKQKNKID